MELGVSLQQVKWFLKIILKNVFQWQAELSGNLIIIKIFLVLNIQHLEISQRNLLRRAQLLSPMSSLLTRWKFHLQQLEPPSLKKVMVLVARALVSTDPKKDPKFRSLVQVPLHADKFQSVSSVCFMTEVTCQLQLSMVLKTKSTGKLKSNNLTIIIIFQFSLRVSVKRWIPTDSSQSKASSTCLRKEVPRLCQSFLNSLCPSKQLWTLVIQRLFQLPWKFYKPW